MVLVHHIALTASDHNVSCKYYDVILGALGLERHHTSETVCSWVFPKESCPEFLIYAAHDDLKDIPHRTYSPGAHHYCLSVASKDIVYRVHDAARQIGSVVFEALESYSKYAKNVGSEDYFAVFLSDPDCIKLEFAWIPKEL